jgi:hypothetical protein
MSNVTPNPAQSLNPALTQSIQNLYGRFTNLADLQDGVSEHMQALLNQMQTLLNNQNEFPVDKEDLRKLENILQKDMPGLLDIYEKLPMMYRNEKLLKNHRTHRQNCIANLMLLSDIMLDIEEKTISQFDNIMAVQQHALREIYDTDNLQTSEVIHNHPVHEITENRDDIVQIKKTQVQVETEREVEAQESVQENENLLPVAESSSEEPVAIDLSDFIGNMDEDDDLSETMDEETQALLKKLEPATVEMKKEKKKVSSFNLYTHGFLGKDDLLDNLLFTDHKKLPLIKKGSALVDNFNWLQYKNSHPELNLQTMEQTFIKPVSTVESDTNTGLNANDRYNKRKENKALMQAKQKQPGMMNRFLASMNSFYRKIGFHKDNTAEMEKFLRMIKSDTFTPEFPFSYHDKVKKCQDMLPIALKDKNPLCPQVIEHCVMFIAESGVHSQLLHDEKIVNIATKPNRQILFETLNRYDEIRQWWSAKNLEEDNSYKYLMDIIKTGDDNKIMFAVYNTLRFNPAFLSEQNEVGRKNLAIINQYEYAAECMMTYHEDREDEKYYGRHAHLKAREEAINDSIKNKDNENEKLLNEKLLRKMLDVEYDRQQEKLEKQQDIEDEAYERAMDNLDNLEKMKEDQEYGLLTMDDYDRKLHQWMYPDVDKNLFVNNQGQHFENLEDALESLKYDLEKSRAKADKVQARFVEAASKIQTKEVLYGNNNQRNESESETIEIEKAKRNSVKRIKL